MLSQVDEDGYTPLLVAASIGLTEIVQTLVEEKANVDYVAPDHATALLFGVQENNAELITALVKECNANPNVRKGEGQTSLYIAAQEGLAESVTLLLELKVGGGRDYACVSRHFCCHSNPCCARLRNVFERLLFDCVCGSCTE